MSYFSHEFITHILTKKNSKGILYCVCVFDKSLPLSSSLFLFYIKKLDKYACLKIDQQQGKADEINTKIQYFKN